MGNLGKDLGNYLNLFNEIKYLKALKNLCRYLFYNIIINLVEEFSEKDKLYIFFLFLQLKL